MAAEDWIKYYSNLSDTELLAQAATAERKKYPIRWTFLESELERRGLSDQTNGALQIAKVTSDSEDEFKPEHEPIWKEVIRLTEGSAQSTQTLLTLTFLSFFLFGALHSLRDGVTFAAHLVAVLTIHELGHVIAMKLLGYKDVSILFIPFMGALAKGNSEANHAIKSAAIALAGPILGILSSIVALTVYRYNFDLHFLPKYALLSLNINLANLLPLWPLDGGRFFQETFLSRRPVGGFIVSLLGALGILYLALKINSIGIGVFSFISINLAFCYLRIHRLAEGLRGTIGNLDGSTPSKTQVAKLYGALTRMNKAYLVNMEDPKSTSRAANAIQTVWRLVRTRHPRLKERLAIFVGGILVVGCLVMITRIQFAHLPHMVKLGLNLIQFKAR